MSDTYEHMMVHLDNGRFTCDCGETESSADQRDVHIHIEWALRELLRKARGVPSTPEKCPTCNDERRVRSIRYPKEQRPEGADAKRWNWWMPCPDCAPSTLPDPAEDRPSPT